MRVANWDIFYDAALNYYLEHGNLLVPSNYIDLDGVKLGAWISSKRQAIKKKSGCLSEEQIELLNKIGMVWDVHEYNWCENYKKTLKYFLENGNIFVENNYVTEDGFKLGMWLAAQKNEYSKGTLSEKKIELLEDIHIVWSVLDFYWNEKYKSAVNYFNTFGNLLVPSNYVDSNGFYLGRWIEGQRLAKKGIGNYKITLEQEKKLDEIGMVWNVHEYTWFNMYNLAKKYYEEYGDLRIPFYYTVDGIRLGAWINAQRQIRKGNAKGKMTDKKVELLQSIGMIWDIAPKKKRKKK